VTNQEQVRSLVDQATQRFGRVDVVVNNAGIIQVGPMSVNITSIGGMVSVPHLLPYTGAKFGPSACQRADGPNLARKGSP
jgi:hypothetical protein